MPNSMGDFETKSEAESEDLPEDSALNQLEDAVEDLPQELASFSALTS